MSEEEFKNRVIKAAEKDIFITEDGFYVFDGIYDYQLIWIAEYLKEKNAEWQYVMDNDPAINGELE